MCKTFQLGDYSPSFELGKRYVESLTLITGEIVDNEEKTVETILERGISK